VDLSWRCRRSLGTGFQRTGAVDSRASPIVLLQCPSSCDVVWPLRCSSFLAIRCDHLLQPESTSDCWQGCGLLWLPGFVCGVPRGDVTSELRQNGPERQRGAYAPAREPFILLAIALLPDNGVRGASLGSMDTAPLARGTLRCAVVCDGLQTKNFIGLLAARS